METNSNETLDEKKVDTIKLRLLELETDNIVKKESNPAMVDKIQRMIMTEVEKRRSYKVSKCTIFDSMPGNRKASSLQIKRRTLLF